MNELTSSPKLGYPSLVSQIEYPPELLGEYSSYTSLVDAVTCYLIGLAKVGSKCTFRELYRNLHIPLVVTYSYHRKLISRICFEINRKMYEEGKPLIGVLLCGETDGYITGKGFFELMDYPEFCDGLHLNKEIVTHQAAFFGIHARRCWLYWSKQRKAEEKTASEIQAKQGSKQSTS